MLNMRRFVIRDLNLISTLCLMVARHDPNQIGRAGEIVARKILEKLYPPPNYVVQDLNDFEECRFSKETESLSEDK
ncbi:MAG: hypothetical protein NO515_05990, partial [Candidatus Methanomethylicia archaeon]|nr:hypothetical protein [Candidatus Methanomethylicia archaeon]